MVARPLNECVKIFLFVWELLESAFSDIFKTWPQKKTKHNIATWSSEWEGRKDSKLLPSEKHGHELKMLHGATEGKYFSFDTQRTLKQTQAVISLLPADKTSTTQAYKPSVRTNTPPGLYRISY